MARVEHASCGYSAFAPGCDEAACLLHRVEVSLMRGWDETALQRRLDAVIEQTAYALLGLEATTTAAPAPRRSAPGHHRRP